MEGSPHGPISVDRLLAELLPQAEGRLACLLFRRMMWCGRWLTVLSLCVGWWICAAEVPMGVRQEIVGIIRKLLERQIEFT